MKTAITNCVFSPGMVERLKAADIPCQTDSDQDRPLNKQLPATKEELAVLKQKYGGTYHSHIGKFLHIQQKKTEKGFPQATV